MISVEPKSSVFEEKAWAISGCFPRNRPVLILPVTLVGISLLKDGFLLALSNGMLNQ